ncbi:aminotransferase class I/II-fold pyridoxal phosphate-dependent enzyme [Candidatus Zixiibacteriota bacterium]
MDLFQKCFQWKDWKTAQQFGYYPYFTSIQSEAGPIVEIDGEQKIMLGSNNYMGLTNHPEVKQAATDALMKYGSGCTGSRFLNGTLDIHVELEEALASWLGKEAALVFSTGFFVNQGVISALVSSDDVIISDRLNHASIVEGCKLAAGETIRYRHNDMEDLERILQKIPKSAGKFIITDGVFSGEGTIANVRGIVALAKQYDARVMVDEAHSVGVYGSEGRGVADEQGQLDATDLYMATFSKSFGGVGGFVAGPYEVIMWIRHKARPMIFSASLPPASVAGARKALDLIREGDEMRAKLIANADRMRAGLQEIGFDTGKSTSQIIPLQIGEDLKCVKFWKALFKAGVFTNAFIHPATPPNSALIRTSYMPTHTDEMLDKALDLLQRVGKKHNIIR